MNKRIISATLVAIPLLAMSQTAIDAYQLSRYDLRGTARFMSMGGAFGALGGDLSTLNQNPGGIGVYRKSEIGFTLDIEIQSSKATTPMAMNKDSQTKVYANNFGYVGTVQTGSDVMQSFNWGFSYNRAASFNRRYHGTATMNGSLSNYYAGDASKWQFSANELVGSDDNYWNANHAPWMSILSYNAFLINPVGNTTQYNGMWQSGTTGISSFDVEEKGYVDEYEINLGGNFSDVVYWGIGIGITDIDYKQYTYYTEDMNGAVIPNQRLATQAEIDNPTLKDYIVDGKIVDGTTTGNGGYGLDSRKHISGTGFNFKAGVIVRPINELRLGFAIHTPTYYNLTQNNDGIVDYGFGYTDGPAAANYTGTPIEAYNWKLRTPWRMIVSAAGVIGSKAIVSLDYEYRPYQNISTKFDNGDNCTDINGDVKDYYKAANIIRVGAEYRLTNSVSLRAGYAYESTPTGSEVKNNELPVYTSNPYDTGTTPSYSLDNSTQYITCGIGYRYKNFYADAAYVHKSRKSSFHAFTPNEYAGATPYNASIKENYNNIVLSIGFKF